MDVKTLGKRLDEINYLVGIWRDNDDQKACEKAFDLHVVLESDLIKDGSPLSVVWQPERVCYVLV